MTVSALHRETENYLISKIPDLRRWNFKKAVCDEIGMFNGLIDNKVPAKNAWRDFSQDRTAMAWPKFQPDLYSIRYDEIAKLKVLTIIEVEYTSTIFDKNKRSSLYSMIHWVDEHNDFDQSIRVWVYSATHQTIKRVNISALFTEICRLHVDGTDFYTLPPEHFIGFLQDDEIYNPLH